MEEKYFGRLPKDPEGRCIMTRDGHIGNIKEVNGGKVVTTCGTFPKEDVMVRNGIEVGDCMTHKKKFCVVMKRMHREVTLASEDGVTTVSDIYDSVSSAETWPAGFFYPGERVEYGKSEYVVTDRVNGFLVLKNKDGLEYAKETDIRTLETDKRLQGNVTPSFSLLTQEEMEEAYCCGHFLAAVEFCTRNGISMKTMRKLLRKKP